MIIKKVKLENIRSHVNSEINFPIGSNLLIGDIGSGKSTILLAIEFALFGLRRGVLTGSSLLRAGEKRGSVELYFVIDNSDIVIKRTLKREKTVTQDSGYIIINGHKKEGTAIELKQKVLEILNYPMELLTKGKSLIYRYTVYTPQEEMKHILLSDTDVRLDTLRKVFGIDKYKRITENSKILNLKLKERVKELSGMISDLDDRMKDLEEKKTLSNKIDEKIKLLIPELDEIKKKVSKKEVDIRSVEEDIRRLNELKKELEVVAVSIRYKLEERTRNNEEVADLRSKIEKLKAEVKEVVFADELLSGKEQLLKVLETDLAEIGKKVREFEVKEKQSHDLKNSILNLDVCPVCKQEVTQAHKDNVVTAEDVKIREFKDKHQRSLEREMETRKKISELKGEIEVLRDKKKEKEMNELRLRDIKEKEERLGHILKRQDLLKKEIGSLNIQKIDLNKKITEFGDLEQKFSVLKKELDELRGGQKDVEIQKSELERQQKDLTEVLLQLEKEINNKLMLKKEMEQVILLNNWIGETFVSLMTNMEKQIMLSVHNDFNRLFQNWFTILVDTEAIKIRIDDEFTPRIEQNGYDIDYSFLSGGEKTAAALAYRLSLNQVINDLMSKIKTHDLLILDEPTDGFSDEQLDRMRLVLDQLNIKQVILVSHETKIETFVDNVIKLRKEGHVSVV